MVLFLVLLLLIYYLRKYINNKHNYISFINKYCKNDILEVSLYLYLKNIKNNILVNSILIRNNVLDKNLNYTNDFVNNYSLYNDLLLSRLEYKMFFKSCYSDLFLSEKSKQKLYDYWNYNDYNKIKWINYMSTMTKYDAPNIVSNLKNFLQTPVLDIGGNDGTFANEINIKTNYKVNVFDLPQVVKIGKKKYKNITFVEGNFLVDRIPINFNTYIFKSVLHDHSDDFVRNILSEVCQKEKRCIICEVMNDLSDIFWENPYFDYLIPFVNVLRNKDWYIDLFYNLNAKTVKHIYDKNNLFTIIIADF